MKNGNTGNRYNNKGINGQFGNEVKGYGYQSDNGKTIPDGAGNRGCKHGIDNVDIVGDTGHEITGFNPLKKGQWQLLHVIVKSISQSHDNVLAHIIQKVHRSIRRQTFYKKNSNDDKRNYHQHPGVFLFKYIFDNRFDQVSRCSRHTRHYGGTPGCHGQLAPMVLDQSQQFFVPAGQFR